MIETTDDPRLGEVRVVRWHESGQYPQLEDTYQCFREAVDVWVRLANRGDHVVSLWANVAGRDFCLLRFTPKVFYGNPASRRYPFAGEFVVGLEGVLGLGFWPKDCTPLKLAETAVSRQHDLIDDMLDRYSMKHGCQQAREAAAQDAVLTGSTPDGVEAIYSAKGGPENCEVDPAVERMFGNTPDKASKQAGAYRHQPVRLK